MKKILTLVLTLALMIGSANAAWATKDEEPKEKPHQTEVTQTQGDNINRNNNSNQQGQLQGQLQGQAQGQLQGQGQDQFQGQVNMLEGFSPSATSGSESSSSSSSSASSNSGASANNRLEITYEDVRQFAPTMTPFQSQNADVQWAPKYKERAHGYVSIHTMAKLVPSVNVEGLLQDGGVVREYTLMGPDEYAKEWPNVVSVSLEPSGKTLAIASMWAGGKKKSNSTAALVKEAARFCSKYGGDHLFLIRQTGNPTVVTSGWGVGLSGNVAAISSDGDVSSVAAPGLGYGRARGGHEYRLGLAFACQQK